MRLAIFLLAGLLGYAQANLECKFPFNYKDAQHTTCTKEGDTKFWCSLTTEWTGKWRYCTEAEAKLAEDAFTCVFPWTYKGQEAKYCLKDKDTYWCSLDKVYSGKWKNCDQKQIDWTQQNTEKCHFPWTYKGVKYETCIKEDGSEKYWCAFDDPNQAGRWRYCNAEETQKAKETKVACVFPFVHNGKSRNVCQKSGDSYWCSLTAVYDGKYRNCDAAEIEVAKKSIKCVFPFIYNGRTYQTCTKEGGSTYWCSLHSVYNGEFRNCYPEEIAEAEKVYGGWGEWGAYGTCSASCGGGSHSRDRKCDNPAPAKGGSDCVGASSETSACNTGACPVAGNWGPFSAYAACSKTCGGGAKLRTRKCNNPAPSAGGAACAGSDTESQVCNTDKCPVHGNWGAYGQWSICSVTCGDGTKTRLRKCDNPVPSDGGMQCEGSDKDMGVCSMTPCPVNPVKHPNLMGFWPLTDETKHEDVSGNDHHGELFQTHYAKGRNNATGGSTLMTGRGTNAYFMVPNNNGKLSPTKSFTLIAYVKPQIYVGNYYPIMYWQSANYAQYTGLKMHASNYYIYSNVMDAATKAGNAYNTPRGVMKVNEWQAVALVFDYDTKSAKIIRNGVAVKVQTWTRYINPFTIGNLYVGAQGASDRFEGLMFCAQLWNIALNSTELQNALKKCDYYNKTPKSALTNARRGMWPLTTAYKGKSVTPKTDDIQMTSAVAPAYGPGEGFGGAYMLKRKGAVMTIPYNFENPLFGRSFTVSFYLRVHRSTGTWAYLANFLENNVKGPILMMKNHKHLSRVYDINKSYKDATAPWQGDFWYWQHVTWTYDWQENWARVIVDGEEVISQALAKRVNVQTAMPLLLGSSSGYYPVASYYCVQTLNVAVNKFEAEELRTKCEQYLVSDNGPRTMPAAQWMLASGHNNDAFGSDAVANPQAGVNYEEGPFGQSDAASIYNESPSSYTLIPNNNVINSPHEFTISVYVKTFDSLRAPIWEYDNSATNPVTSYGDEFWIYSTKNRLYTRLYGLEGSSQDMYSATNTISEGKWTHLAVSFSRTRLRIMLNGVTFAEKFVRSGFPHAQMDQLWVGGTPRGTNVHHRLRGSMSCLQFFHRALKPEEVTIAANTYCNKPANWRNTCPRWIERGYTGSSACVSQSKWSSWSDWSKCSFPCGGGTRTRRRQCQQGTSASYCFGNNADVEECNEAECTTVPPTKAANLVAFWPLTRYSKARDVSGNNNHGELSGGVRPTSGNKGQAGGAMLFDGQSDSYVVVANNDGALSFNKSFTIMTYIYYTHSSYGVVTEFYHMSKSQIQDHFWIYNTNNRVYHNMYNGAGGGSKNFYSPVGQFKPYAWQMIAYSYDFDSHTHKLYVNNRMVASTVGPAGYTPLSTGTLFIGARRADTTTRMRGKLFCMQMYKTALRAEQITAAFKLCSKYVVEADGAFTKARGLWPLTSNAPLANILNRRKRSTGMARAELIGTLPTYGPLGGWGGAQLTYGPDAFIKVQSSADYPVAGDSFTVAFYVNVHDERGGWVNLYDFTRDTKTTADRGSQLWLYASTLRLRIFNRNSNYEKIAQQKFPLRKWVYVVTTYDFGSRLGRVYVDGKLALENAVSVLAAPSLQRKDLVLGNGESSYYGVASWFCLQIHDSAVQQSDIAKLQAACEPYKINGTSSKVLPVAEFMLGKGTAGKDRMGSGCVVEAISPRYAKGPFDAEDSAMYFDDADPQGFALVRNPGQLTFTESFTWAAYLKSEEASVGPILHYADVTQPRSCQGASLYMYNVANRLTSSVCYLDGGGVEWRYTSTNVMIPGRWHHVAWVYDRFAQRNYIYVDGTQRMTGGVSSKGMANTLGSLLLATRTDNAASVNYRWKGAMFCLQGFRFALSINEINAAKKRCESQGL